MKLDRLAQTVLIAGFLVVGCVPGDQGSSGRTSLPTASATLHWATVDLPRGSYCWSSGGHGTCADSADPDVLLRTGYLKPYRTAGGYRVQVAFHSAAAPINSTIEMLRSPRGGRGNIAESSPLAFDLPVDPSQGPGIYVYLVTGNWKEGAVSFFLVIDQLAGTA